MIDYVKILINNPNIDKIKNNSLFDFRVEVSEKNGDCSPKTVAIHHFCNIIIYDTGIVLFTGSIHKLFNSLKEIKAPNYNPNNYKGYNGNMFTLENILEVRKHLCELLFCEPQQMTFQNIEFGINTNPLFCPKQFIKGLLYHTGKSFEFKYSRNYGQVEHNNYRIKIYNKSYQYNMEKHTLRIETGFKKSIEFNRTGIVTFADVNTSTLNKALKLLIMRFDEVVYYDKTISKKGLSKPQIKNLNNYSNITYWIDTLKPNKRDEHKKRLKDFIIHNSNNLHLQLRNDLLKKGVIINRPPNNKKRVIFNSSNIELNLTFKSLLENTKNLFSISS
ncbi:hypothetical protein [Wenyingzhuangia marina]|uniref:Uncharacterized protein n=1 Tax=Wenyingzhuangia marina TaxID=1195760 RepID=A0A1M5T5N6_9FLAO|nr:hypothetical protein [Wenyingzhuangia marina]GGF65362.1 hypothetical protein GCM10011397_05460 [Wenyingzhuangia marina]SHH45673.1 hypothetical protein SAMN05444281_0691 [Wenyingzhuangia marina]